MKYKLSEVELEGGFLGALPLAVKERIIARSVPVELTPRKPIFLNHGETSYGYIPLTAVVSIQSETHDGLIYEVCPIGKEGVVGLAMFMSGTSLQQTAVVSIKGRALRINGDYLLEEFDRGEEFTRHIFRYIHSVLNYVSQSAICARLHNAEQRLCRWLLSTLDRVTSHQIFITHEFLASLLGVNRELVTLLLRNLCKKNIVQCGRGVITVVNRTELLMHSCECYAVTKRDS